jgi:hypothetical protein
MTIGEQLKEIRVQLQQLAHVQAAGPDPEFADLVKIEGLGGGEPVDFDIARPRPEYIQNGDVGEFIKLYRYGTSSQTAPTRGCDSVVSHRDGRSRNEPAQLSDDEQPALSCDEFFGVCEKRASSPHKIRLTKRLVDDEILIEGWTFDGECTFTKVVPAGQPVSEDEPLAKNAISSAMNKTLAALRSSLLAEEVEAAEKAIKALDLPAFLEIVRRAQAAA